MLVEHVLETLGIEMSEKRHGRLWARCPYHDDNDPSWMIRYEKGPHYGHHWCFSCKSGGSLAELVAHVRKESREAAWAWLRSRGAEGYVPEEEPAPSGVDVRVEQVASRSFSMPLEAIFEPLREWVTPARRYVEGRGITASQVDRWGIGYAVDGRLGGRVVIPVRARDGTPASYMARDFSGSEKAKRYVYPSKHEAPDLDAMFGERWWPLPRVRRGMTVFLTEGALDALAVERVIPEGASVASLGGSDVRSMHASLLSTFRRVVVMTDPDEAGDRAAALISAVLARYANVCRVRLPEGTDANNFEPERLAACIRKSLAS